MSGTNYRLERRRDRVAEREQDRADRLAEREMAARERREADARARRDRAAREAARQTRRAELAARRADRIAALRGWVGAHVVDLLIYPLAVASAVMAVPAMADYGQRVYGGETGVVLPVLSELGMWAFAVATMAARREGRASWGLSAGVGVFAAIGALLNLLHGLAGGLVHGVVMAVVSVAGVAAHQLVVAAPRRTGAERRERRVVRLAEARVAKARRVATRSAVVELDAAGGAELVYAPGRYTPARRWLRARLALATTPGLPVEPLDGWDAALAELDAAALLDGPVEVDPPASMTEDDQRGSAGESESGSVAVAEPPEQARPGRRRIDPQARRRMSPEQALERARQVARANGRPVSAEQIRRALRIAPTSARALRDQVNDELYGDAA